MTGSAADPQSTSPTCTTRTSARRCKLRAKDPDDPLELVIVRDMWLTGFDAPSHAHDVRRQDHAGRRPHAGHRPRQPHLPRQARRPDRRPTSASTPDLQEGARRVLAVRPRPGRRAHRADGRGHAGEARHRARLCCTVVDYDPSPDLACVRAPRRSTPRCSTIVMADPDRTEALQRPGARAGQGVRAVWCARRGRGDPQRRPALHRRARGHPEGAESGLWPWRVQAASTSTRRSGNWSTRPSPAIRSSTSTSSPASTRLNCRSSRTSSSTGSPTRTSRTSRWACCVGCSKTRSARSAVPTSCRPGSSPRCSTRRSTATPTAP